ncbi:MAG: S41 family peptidase, partial [Bacteroidaceae bacterium]
LNEVEMARITEFISSISEPNYPHLIIDVRNNPGGSEEVAAKIFSYIAQEAFYSSIYCQINKKEGFDFFKYCTNYVPEQEDLFSEYVSIKGKSGYFLNTNNEILPNEKINFKGKIYVLTNERSFSASTQLAAWVHKYRRGVIVGRETGSAYHQMKALKFAYLQLPNSHVVVNIPLVKTVFDTCVNRIPFGRGVLPNYALPLSLEELSFETGDAILNYAQELIQNGDYLKEIKQTEISAIQKSTKFYICLVMLLLSAFMIYFIIYYTKRIKRANKCLQLRLPSYK